VGGYIATCPAGAESLSLFRNGTGGQGTTIRLGYNISWQQDIGTGGQGTTVRLGYNISWQQDIGTRGQGTTIRMGYKISWQQDIL
jgi:hypothetical protein